MRWTLIVLVLVAAGGACSFDKGGLGSRATDDASVEVTDAPPVGGTPDAKPAPGTPDARPIDARPDANDNAGIGCGTMTCSGNNVCCVSLTPQGTQYDCADKCTSGQGTFSCDGPEDCKQDESCCFTQFSSKCAKTCSGQQDVACRQASDCPVGLGGQPQQCCPTQLPNVEFCRAACF